MSVWHEQTLYDSARNIPTMSDLFRGRSRAAVEAARQEAAIVAEIRQLFPSPDLPEHSPDRPFLYEARLQEPVAPKREVRSAASSVFSSIASRFRRR